MCLDQKASITLIFPNYIATVESQHHILGCVPERGRVPTSESWSYLPKAHSASWKALRFVNAGAKKEKQRLSTSDLGSSWKDQC